ncbi:MAG TPA: GDSL-type esterase/lipase family protein [Bacteroidales bacterium]|nr:GDSL-type esterase/lipase family protein [Bacteroidales bacterium]
MKMLLCMLLFLPGCQFDKDKPLNILIIGDSNGASETGWVFQLNKLRNDADHLINYSIGGNTIGFDNLGRDTLNTLKNISRYIANAEDSIQTLDKILICLGTNDCKAVFDTLQSQVPINLEKLILIIRNHPYASETIPDIVLITPPPIANDSLLLPKYSGGKERLEKLLPYYRIIADKYGCQYADIYHPLSDDFASFTPDGIHLNEAGSIRAAEIINAAIKQASRCASRRSLNSEYEVK